MSYGSRSSSTIETRSYSCNGVSVTYLGGCATGYWTTSSTNGTISHDSGGYMEEFSDGQHAVIGSYQSDDGYYENFPRMATVTRKSDGSITGWSKICDITNLPNAVVRVVNTEY